MKNMNFSPYLSQWYLILVLSLTNVVCLLGQKNKPVNVEATAMVDIPNEMSREQARQMAVRLAKIEALANAFGTQVGRTTVLDVININHNSDVQTVERYLSDNYLMVRGIWLADTRIPFCKIDIDPQTKAQRISCTVYGKARAIVNPRIQFNTQLLNCKQPETGCIKDKLPFIEGESLYLSFISAASGFLAIYYVDDEIAQLALPCLESTQETNIAIQPDQDYLFFTPQLCGEYELALSETARPLGVEVQNLYLIFSSEREIGKPILQLDEFGTKSTSRLQFKEWLDRLRLSREDIQVEIVNVTVKEKP
jgi:hypothetical protein